LAGFPCLCILDSSLSKYTCHPTVLYLSTGFARYLEGLKILVMRVSWLGYLGLKKIKDMLKNLITSEDCTFKRRKCDINTVYIEE